MPGQLIHGAAPNDDRFAAMAEHHNQAVDRGVPHGIADIDLTILDPVGLDLSPRRRLDPPEWAQPRLWEMLADVLPDGFLASCVAVFLHEVRAEKLEIGRAVFRGMHYGILPPGRDHGRQAALLDEGYLRSAVDASCGLSLQAISNGILRDAEASGEGAIALSKLFEGGYSHNMVLVEQSHGTPP